MSDINLTEAKLDPIPVGTRVLGTALMATLAGAIASLWPSKPEVTIYWPVFWPFFIVFTFLFWRYFPAIRIVYLVLTGRQDLRATAQAVLDPGWSMHETDGPGLEGNFQGYPVRLVGLTRGHARAMVCTHSALFLQHPVIHDLHVTAEEAIESPVLQTELGHLKRQPHFVEFYSIANRWHNLGRVLSESPWMLNKQGLLLVRNHAPQGYTAVDLRNELTHFIELIQKGI